MVKLYFFLLSRWRNCFFWTCQMRNVNTQQHLVLTYKQTAAKSPIPPLYVLAHVIEEQLFLVIRWEVRTKWAFAGKAKRRLMRAKPWFTGSAQRRCTHWPLAQRWPMRHFVRRIPARILRVRVQVSDGTVATIKHQDWYKTRISTKYYQLSNHPLVHDPYGRTTQVQYTLNATQPSPKIKKKTLLIGARVH